MNHNGGIRDDEIAEGYILPAAAARVAVSKLMRRAQYALPVQIVK